MLKYLSVLLLVSMPAFAGNFEIAGNSLRKAQGLENVHLFRSPSGYFVTENERTTHIPNHEIDQRIRNYSPETMRAYLAANSVMLNRFGQIYTLKENGGLKGGGPISGAVGGCVAFVVGGVATAVGSATALASGNPGLAATTATAGTAATVAAGTQIALWLTAIPFIP